MYTLLFPEPLTHNWHFFSSFTITWTHPSHLSSFTFPLSPHFLFFTSLHILRTLTAHSTHTAIALNDPLLMALYKRDDRGPEYSIFVGDLGPEVNEYVLVSLFQARFPSCKSAKIMTDAMTGQSRGYGFVRFSDENDQQRALVEMQGVYCGNRPMRISTATPKNR